ncbi:DoxX family membrane protein [Archangium lansingense]|uniref:DoxX family membrane protein n=1 Tax=Archangium lansingense TaxID=2995310 RepID=A0ABT4A9G3_9BACT|nr:DoxX family membrane protein [Archangium lansinium]MCY1078293.1 DoxX family membrane protein [Archangium lansinium]
MKTSTPPEEVSLPFLGLTHATAGHFLLRLALGINILGHGLVRIGNPGAFADALVQLFANTWIPSPLVRLFALLLPFIETVLGVLLTLGLLTRTALFAGGLLMVALIFGTTLRSDWETVGLQMIYAALYSALMATAHFNRLSVDAWWAKNRSHPVSDSAQRPASVS